MNKLTDKIYYAEQAILDKIESDFELVERKNWYKLYQNKIDKSFWRLDEWDKYQEQFFVKLESNENWTKFNDKELRIELLSKFRGISEKKCIWKDCKKLALNGLVYCERHAYEELGIRK